MERKFYTDDFEQLLKEKSDDFRMYPSKRVWHSIYNDLHPGRKWPSIAVSMVLIIALLMVGYWNNNFSKTTIAAGNANKNTVPHINASANDNVAINNTLLPPNTGFGNGTSGTSSPKNIVTKANQTETINSVPNYLTSNGIVLNTSPAVKQPGAESKIDVQANATQFNSSLNNQQQCANNPITATTKLNAGLENILPAINFYNAQQNNPKAIASAGINPGNIVNTTDDQVLNNNSNTVVDADGNNSIKTESISKDQVTTNKDTKVVKPTVTVTATDKKLLSANDDKAWIEDYAFHNKSKRKKWQDRTALEIYITPSVGYRTLTNDAKYNTVVPASPLSGTSVTSVDANKSVNQTPGLGLEAGFGITYSVAKNLRIKAGIQANYTNYGVNAEETNHPVLTTLLLVDPNNDYSYIKPITSTLANSSGAQTIKVHSQSYQISLPVGVALKLGGNSKLEWYAGATLQPTAIIGSKAFLISADRKNYVEDPTLLRRWNLNAGVETYVNYKLDGFTLQVGPQFRYQLLSTYKNIYTVKENFYNVGLKIGILKNF